MSILQDTRVAGRSFFARPGFTLAAVATLALGIGANVAMFSVLHAELLRPLPFEDSERLVYLWNQREDRALRLAPSAAMIAGLRAQDDLFEDVAAFGRRRFAVSENGEPRSVEGALISDNLLSLLRVSPFHGRAWGPGAARPGSARQALISHEHWQARLGGDPDVVGKIITLDDVAYSIAGVMPPGLRFPAPDTAVWVPVAIGTDGVASAPRSLNAIARLQAAVSVERAQRGLDERRSTLEAAAVDRVGWDTRIVRPRELLDRDTERGLWLLQAAVGVLLGVACANVAGMLLARGTARKREISVRSALGASRWRLARQFFVESLLLASAGAAAGLLLALWSLDLLVARLPEGLLRSSASAVDVDMPMLGFAAGMALLSSLLGGLVPIVRLSRMPAGIRLGHQTATGGNRFGATRLLAVAETALACVLLVGAALIVRTFDRLAHSDPGFVADGLVALPVALPASRFDEDARRRFLAELDRAVDTMPEAVAQRAAMGTALPPRGSGVLFGTVEIEGRPNDETEPRVFGSGWVAPGYFRTLGVPIRAGRPLSEADRDRHAVVIGESMARYYWPDQNAVGRRLRFPPDDDWLTVVGVAADVKMFDMRSSVIQHQLYFPLGGTGHESIWVIARTHADARPEALVAELRARIWAIDDSLPLGQAAAGRDLVVGTLDQERLNAGLLGLFATLALALAGVGLYSSLSLGVTQRTQEIGVRMALGARGVDMRRLLFRQGLTLTLAGLVVGVGVSLLATRWLESLLYDVRPGDPWALAAACVTLLGVSVLAIWVPARRASQTDPLAALHTDT